MKLTINLIRGGSTESTRAGRYMGMLDEPLDWQGRVQLYEDAVQGRYPETRLVFASGLLRSRETAGILYPHTPAIIIKELAPLDMGRFTGREYGEVREDKLFQQWAEAEQLLAYPDGEDPHAFSVRCGTALRRIAREMTSKGLESAVVITHRSVLRAMLQRFAVPRSQFHDWRPEHGGGYAVEFQTEPAQLRILRAL